MKVDKSKWVESTLGYCLISLRTGLNPRLNFKLNEPGSNNYYITVRELNGRGLTITDKTDKFPDYAFPLINNRSNLEVGDVLFTGTGTIGKTALVSETPQNWNIKEGVYALKPNSELIDSEYLLHYLHSINLMEFCRVNSKGATIQSVPMATLKKAPIILPPLDKQQGIAKELDTLQIMIDGYKAQIADLTELAKSLFLDMFGDPIINDKGWENKLLSKVGNFARGVSTHRPRNAPELLGGIMPLIQTGDIANAGMYITKHSKTYSELGVKQSKVWSAGTLCITIAANIGKCSILKFEACFPDSVVGYIPNNNFVYNEYLFYVFERLQSIMEANAPGVAQKNINLAYLNSLQVPLPPIELQKEFISKINCIEKQKELLREQLTDAEQLMAERMQYYFS